MQAKPKSNSVITHTLREDGAIVFSVRGAGPNGQSPAELVLDPKALSEKNRERAMIHGLVQKVSDRAALSRNTTNGASATPQEKLAAMKGLVDFLMTGTTEWAPAREGGGRGPTGLDPILVAAVAEHTGRTREEVLDLVAKGAEKKGVTKAVFLGALGGATAIKPIVERMREEQKKGLDVDGDDLLTDMLDPQGE